MTFGKYRRLSYETDANCREGSKVSGEVEVKSKVRISQLDGQGPPGMMTRRVGVRSCDDHYRTKRLQH